MNVNQKHHTSVDDYGNVRLGEYVMNLPEQVAALAIELLERLAAMLPARDGCLDTIALDCLELFAANGYALDGRVASAGALLDICGRVIEDIAEGDFGASAASLMFSAEVHTRHLGMASLAADLRNSSRIVR